MARYIDADALKDRMFNYYECVNENTGKENYRGETLMDYEVADMIEDCIDNAPTVDAIEVVRCKDCKYWTGKDYDGCCINNGLATRYANDFCNCGERK